MERGISDTHNINKTVSKVSKHVHFMKFFPLAFFFFYIIYLFIYLFIFGCVGSSLLHMGFL